MDLTGDPVSSEAFYREKKPTKKKKIIRDLCELDKEYNDPRIPNARTR